MNTPMAEYLYNAILDCVEHNVSGDYHHQMWNLLSGNTAMSLKGKYKNMLWDLLC